MKRLIVVICTIAFLLVFYTCFKSNRGTNPFVAAFERNRNAFEKGYERIYIEPNSDVARQIILTLEDASIDQIEHRKDFVLFLFSGTPIDDYHAIVRLPDSFDNPQTSRLFIGYDVVMWQRIDGRWAYLSWKK